MNTHDIELPPLPDWMDRFQIPSDDQDESGFNWLGDRMRQYAKVAVKADRQKPVAVDGAMMERIAALLYEETTGESWTADDIHIFARSYYWILAHKVATIVHACRAEGEQ